MKERLRERERNQCIQTLSQAQDKERSLRIFSSAYFSLSLNYTRGGAEEGRKTHPSEFSFRKRGKERKIEEKCSDLKDTGSTELLIFPQQRYKMK